MFGFLTACVVITETTKTTVAKMKRKRMAGRLPTNPWRENGKNRWIKNSTRAALNLLLQPSELILKSLAVLQMLASPHPVNSTAAMVVTSYFTSLELSILHLSSPRVCGEGRR